MIAVIAGATGLTGRELVQQLETDPRITEIRALVRSPSRLHGASGRLDGTTGPLHDAASPPEAAKLRQIPLPPTGFEGIEDSADPLLSGDVYFCALGTTIKKAGSQAEFRRVDHDAVVSFARLCSRRGGRALALISATGANSRSRIFYSRVKGEAEQEVLSLSIPRTLIARPSLLIGDRNERRPGERAGIQIYRALAPLLPHAIRKRLGTDVPTLVSRLIQETLATPAGTTILEAREV